MDGQKIKDVRITAANLFDFDNQFVLEGDALTAGDHTFTLEKQGTGPLYFNAYLSNFTLEDPITRAGLEIKVNRQFYKLHPGAGERESGRARTARRWSSGWRSTSAPRWPTWTR